MEIKLKNLTKVFPGNPKKNIPDSTAVADLNLDIESGKLIGLLGPSGCGKSTTLYMIAGLKAPTDGEIWFGDDDVTHLTPEKREIGLVFQNYALYPHMTVYDNVKFPLTNLNVVTSKKAKKIEDNKLVVSLLENELDDITEIIRNSQFKGRYSKDMTARKMVFKYHIVTSIAERIFKILYKYVDDATNLHEARDLAVRDISAENEKLLAAYEKKGFSVDEKFYIHDANGNKIEQKRKLNKDEIDA